MKKLKSPKIFIPYTIPIFITGVIIHLNSSYPKLEDISYLSIFTKFLVAIQPAIWIYFERAGFKNTISYYMMINGVLTFYTGCFQNMMDEIYKTKGILYYLEEILIPLGLGLISSAVIIRFLNERNINRILLKERKKIYRKSIKDPLTGLYNRYYLEENMETLLCNLNYDIPKIVLAFIDIDNFKTINDTYGHAKGDEVLRSIGLEINSGIRSSDYAFRYGGDEFVLIYSDMEPEAVLKIVERIKENVSIIAKSEGIELSLSIGITSHRRSENYKDLIHRADQIMYEAKKKGKNQIALVAY